MKDRNVKQATLNGGYSGRRKEMKGVKEGEYG
jgi:hypothetical protein